MATPAPKSEPSRGGAVLALCFSIAATEGYDLQAAAVAATQLRNEFSIPPETLGWIFSAGTFGLLIGAALGGRLSDRYGRKQTLLTSVLIFGLISIVASFAQSTGQLLACRFLIGIGLGGALPNLIAIAAETSPPARRARAVAVVIAGLSLGGALVSLFGVAAGSWRMVFLFGGAAPLILCLPLARLRLGHRGKLAGEAATTGIATALFAGHRLAGTLLLWAASFLVLISVYLLANWLPTLLVERGLDRGSALWVQVAFNLAGILGGVTSGWLLDRPTVRTAGIVAIYVVYLTSLFVLARTSADFFLLLLAGGMVGAATTAVSSVQYALAPALYPDTIRGTGVGFAVAVGRLGSIAGPVIAGTLLGAGVAGGDVLMAMLPVIALAAVAAALLSRRIAKIKSSLEEF